MKYRIPAYLAYKQMKLSKRYEICDFAGYSQWLYHSELFYILYQFQQSSDQREERI